MVLLIPPETPLGSVEVGSQLLTLLAFWVPVSAPDTGGVFDSEAQLSEEPCQGTSSSCAVHCQAIRHQNASHLPSAFFISLPGSQYWIYDGERRVSGPAPIMELGLPASPVQAALVWGAEKNKIYIFSGGNYWRFNPHRRQVDNIYPRAMADWRGVPQQIDAAFQDEFGQCSRGCLPRAGHSDWHHCPAGRAWQI